MAKIEVTDDRNIYTADFNDSDIRNIYYRLIDILSAIKLVGGNVFLNKTIHNHPKIKNFMLEYLKDDILSIEREISNKLGE